MDLSVRYRPAGSRIIHEGFDAEVVIVNLDTGRYYCVQNEGAEVWQLLMQGFSVGQIATALVARYAGSDTFITEGIARLCADLCAEHLLVRADGETSLSPTSVAAATGPLPTGATPSFQASRLQIYTDMQDLLLLDPIHEVDASGWPLARNDNREPNP